MKGFWVVTAGGWVVGPVHATKAAALAWAVKVVADGWKHVAVVPA